MQTLQLDYCQSDSCLTCLSACSKAVPASSTTQHALTQQSPCMQDSAKTMEQVWAVLQKHNKVSLLQLVLSHASFAQTVENLFALSMLVSHCRVFVVSLWQHAHIDQGPAHGTRPYS